MSPRRGEQILNALDELDDEANDELVADPELQRLDKQRSPWSAAGGGEAANASPMVHYGSERDAVLASLNAAVEVESPTKLLGAAGGGRGEVLGRRMPLDEPLRARMAFERHLAATNAKKKSGAAAPDNVSKRPSLFRRLTGAGKAKA